ncbi:MAG TPA: cupin domain-containing protein [Burkholderiales bacterium]|nr:cupin domain-containing protein [Burkholderiales bacterium]
MTDAISIANAEHYGWGDGCDGWHLLQDPRLSVIHERVPVGKGEVSHYHSVAQQFFFIISGRASVELDGRLIHLTPGEGLHVAPGRTHKFRNAGDTAVEFLVISSPTSRGDRKDVV